MGGQVFRTGNEGTCHMGQSVLKTIQLSTHCQCHARRGGISCSRVHPWTQDTNNNNIPPGRGVPEWLRILQPAHMQDCHEHRFRSGGTSYDPLLPEGVGGITTSNLAMEMNNMHMHHSCNCYWLHQRSELSNQASCTLRGVHARMRATHSCRLPQQDETVALIELLVRSANKIVKTKRK